MNISIKSLCLAGLLLAAGAATAQTTLGYTNGTVSRKDGYRFGTSMSQGMCIYLPAEKAALLKGTSLTAVSTALGTSQITDWQLFITKELDGTPIYTQALSGAKTKMTEYALTTPYVFDGDPVYIGYTFTTEYTSTSLLLFDQSSNLPEGLSWVLNDEAWTDVSQGGYGAPNIQLTVTGLDNFTDLLAKPVLPTGYIIADSTQVFEGQLFNFGTETVTSFDVTCKIGDGEPVTLNVSGVTLKSGETYDFQLPPYTTSEVGRLGLEVTVSNVNGGVDVTPGDNTATSSVFFYPAGIEKKILIETFTGQACGNCPGGHTSLAKAISGIEENFIEVAHHAGYQPDLFTMAEDADYTWFYGSSSTYAPAAMFNRRPITTSATSVVFQSNVDSDNKTAAQAFLGAEPYVSLKLYNQYDEETRKGSLILDVHTYVEPSDYQHVFNVFLVQNGIVAYQASASSEYVHNHVFRGTLTGNSTGYAITLNEGETRRYTIPYEIPEFIASDYYGEETTYGFNSDPANMYIVAYVGDYSGDPMTSWIYNAASIDVLTNNSASAVERVENAATVASLRCGADGLVYVTGECTAVEVYSLAGALVKRVEAGVASFSLESGIYVARIRKADGTVVAQKLVVK